MSIQEIIKIKEDKVVFKKRNADGSFNKSVIIPTVMYPLNGEFDVFTKRNCKQVEDKMILNLFDQVKPKTAKCFDNVQALQVLLMANGFDSKVYVGWVITSIYDEPTFHCWLMLGDSLLDYSDIFKSFEKVEFESREECIKALSQIKKEKNSKKCYPVGVPNSDFIYIGCESTTEKGKKQFKKLLEDYPDHPAYIKTNKAGYTFTQSLLEQER